MSDPTYRLLLELAGRVDDDLLATGRELVAVGEEGHALELLVAELVAGRVELPGTVRPELVAEAAARRVQPDADRCLPRGTGEDPEHRFTGTGPDGPAIAAAVATVPELADGALAWRTTPAGAAPGALPHPVLLARAGDGGAAEVVTYQGQAALTRAGLVASVEVQGVDDPHPDYHRAARAASVPVRSLAGSRLPEAEAVGRGSGDTGAPGDEHGPASSGTGAASSAAAAGAAGDRSEPVSDPETGDPVKTTADTPPSGIPVVPAHADRPDPGPPGSGAARPPRTGLADAWTGPVAPGPSGFPASVADHAATRAEPRSLAAGPDPTGVPRPDRTSGRPVGPAPSLGAEPAAAAAPSVTTDPPGAEPPGFTEPPGFAAPPDTAEPEPGRPPIGSSGAERPADERHLPAAGPSSPPAPAGDLPAGTGTGPAPGAGTFDDGPVTHPVPAHDPAGPGPDGGDPVHPAPRPSPPIRALREASAPAGTASEWFDDPGTADPSGNGVHAAAPRNGSPPVAPPSDSPAVPAHDEDAWTRDWASGAWAGDVLAEPATEGLSHPGADTAGVPNPQVAGTDAPTPPPGVPIVRAPAPPPGTADGSGRPRHLLLGEDTETGGDTGEAEESTDAAPGGIEAAPDPPHDAVVDAAATTPGEDAPATGERVRPSPPSPGALADRLSPTEQQLLARLHEELESRESGGEPTPRNGTARRPRPGPAA